MRAFIEKHKLLTDILITVLLCAVMLIAMEIRQPYFFLQDDNCDSYVCQYAYSLESVIQGEFPYYNFHQFGGMRYLDKGQTGQLNIFVYIAGAMSELFLGHIGGVLDFTAALYLVAGAVGMLLLLQKRFKTGRAASVIGAIAWSFNSFSIYCGSNWLIAIILTGCLPWIILTTGYLVEHDGIKALILAAIPKVFMFYGGHPQYFIYAILFDYLFAVSYIFFFTAKGERLKAQGKFLLKYFISGLPVLLWSLPLLVPMYEMMTSSADRAAAFDWEYFSDRTFRLKDLVLGLIAPFLQLDITGFMEVDGVEIAVVDCMVAIQKNMCHIGYILFMSALLGLVHIVFGRNGAKNKETLIRKKQMLALIPCALIALFWAGTLWFNRIVFLIPVLNRFRFPFKLMQYFLLFLIVFASIALDWYLSKKKNNRLLPVLLIAVQVINLTGLYMLIPVRNFVVYTNSKVPYAEPWLEELADHRYVTVMDYLDFYDTEHLDEFGNSDPTRVPRDTVALLTNNYATYFGLDDISGYEILNNNELHAANGEMLTYIEDVGGSIGVIYDGMVEQMRDRGVSLYITVPENADCVESCLAPYGITRWKEDDKRVIFYDSEAEPRAYYSDASEDYGEVSLDVHVNYLEVTTPAEFEGGSVTVNFIHDRGFIATVDGQQMPITDCGNCSDMIVSDVPSGAHTVVFRFVDNSFRNSLIVTSAVTVLLAAGMLIGRKFKNKEN
ncbi:MAG: hypothetical protein K6A37_06500 [Saccharofermentans sp.]|nr:hypothetical protein [Saccharofermentans sp.]